MTLNLYEYTVIQCSAKQKYVICKDIDYGEPYESEELPTLQNHMDYISDENVKVILTKGLSQLKDHEINIQVRKRFINLLKNGNRIGKIRRRKKCFKIKSSLKGEESDYYYIYTENDWNIFLEKEITPYL